MMGWLRIGVALSVLALTSILLTPVQWAILKTGRFNPAFLPRLWHRIAVRVFGLRINVTGEISLHRPLLLAANHISWTDIMVLGSLGEVAYIAKSDVAGWPIFGTFARMQRTIFVERHRRGKSSDQAVEVADRLAGDDIIVLFAEGSTGDGNHILPFKSTLFGAARMVAGADEAKTVLIQPVAIAYTRLQGMPMGRQHRGVASWVGDAELVPHLVSLLRERAIDVDVAFGPVIEFTAGSDRKHVTRQAESAVRAMLQDALRHRQRAVQKPR
ncbi:1-acyl-sn-glycerol-3-phosphate acyltransferase [Mesorhizobium sp. NBSH29]|uniref:lysophospholipid acyltransferase family protein n=1 Tax=Mesorhizobium sp. NBSH29 TaxID=2654249 RepID=UPI001896557C|nr:1-acyl-sn-glycerol-3-phosphate acyltransferase [Mesorhizobium sp. NBSH29]QPC86509.1 1-acyl-sn-glycerol-3-phosphate acyltransferase [Mesorhizobium sp. NBSH29]